MPTSSGSSYPSLYGRQPDRLLSRRSGTEKRSAYYSSPTSPIYSTTPKTSVRDRTNNLLNPSAITTDFRTKIDINNNQTRSTNRPYKAEHYTSYNPTSSTSSSIYGSHSKPTSISPHYPSSHHSSSRSNSVDSGRNLTRARRSSLASQNYNDSCSSALDSEYDVKSSSSDAYHDSGNVGLTNLGNTCFMNSVLQCLINTRSLKDYVISEQRSRDINRTTSSMKGALMEEYATLVKKIWETSSSSSIAPRELKSRVTRFAPRFGGYNQQDAQEFLRYLLQGLHEDVNRVKTKPKYIGCDEEAEAKMTDTEKAQEYWSRYTRFDDSAIVDLFVGQLKSELVCQTCGYRSVTFDPFWDLSLPIPKNRHEIDIQDCMESFMKEEMLDGDERPTCAKCKQHRRCAKKFKIQRFPKILVLHLKRFSGERYRQKLSTKVNFELKGLKLRQFGVDADRSAEYNLYGISNHVGSVYSGHYTAYCKHPYRHRWYSFNDSRVSGVSASELVSEEAYLLFYELVQ